MRKAIVTLLCCALALAFWACSGAEETPPGPDWKPDEPATTNSTDGVKPAPADDADSTASDDTSPAPDDADEDWRADTPEEAFHLMKKAGVARNFGALYDLMSKGSHEQFGKMKAMIVSSMESMVQMTPEDKREEAEAGQRKLFEEQFGVSSLEELKSMSVRDFFVRMLEKQAEAQGSDFMAEVEGVKLMKVEKAADGETATLTTEDGKGKEETAQLVLEDGSWKFDLDLTEIADGS